MFTSIYRAIAVAQAASAASRMMMHVSNRQLADMGINRETFVAESVARVKAEFAEKDKVKANKSVRGMVANLTNPNLVGAV